ncbi:sensor histidine kinase [Oceanirhabdus seepicola]|uniref:sensor histidine kinase n=1 Tax=Oceanirhabdus seepicola TaxID=2828781 RepID=UPI0020331018|nr:ATP-binding protein [Oceanirhabdus seepicola]
MTLLDECIDTNNLNKVSLFKINNEEKQCLKLIKTYKKQTEDIINNTTDKFKENKEFMDIWVHDIKMPISILKIIIERNQVPECEKLLDKIDDEVTRIENSVERVLYLSRLESFHKDFLIQEVNLEKVVREIIRKYSKYFIANKIKLSLENVNYYALSDKKWLLFIFDQIISNALKYTESDDSISIIGEKTDNTFKVIIKDTGCGIKKEDLDRIFEKGFTGSRGRNMMKSTGLGLYLAKELCNKLGHHIHVHSKYNEYTEFIIVFKENY